MSAQPVASAAPPSLVTPELFRQAMGSFVTGVAVVTVAGGDGPHGTTVNSFTSLSLEPASVLVCLATGSRTVGMVRASGAFAVNVLSRRQEHLGAHFASANRTSGDASFGGVSHHPGVTGAPLLDGSLAHLDCTTEGVVPVGDHVIVIGRVVGLALGDEHAALAFHRGRFLGLGGAADQSHDGVGRP